MYLTVSFICKLFAAHIEHFEGNSFDLAHGVKNMADEVKNMADEVKNMADGVKNMAR